MLTNAYKRRAYIRRFTETVVSTSYVSSVTPMCAACLKSTGEVDASFQQIFHLYVAPPPPQPLQYIVATVNGKDRRGEDFTG